jgi:hypothetical protein
MQKCSIRYLELTFLMVGRVWMIIAFVDGVNVQRDQTSRAIVAVIDRHEAVVCFALVSLNRLRDSLSKAEALILDVVRCSVQGRRCRYDSDSMESKKQ